MSGFSESFTRLNSRCQPGLHHPKSWLRPLNLLLSWFTHRTVDKKPWFSSVLGRGPQFHMALSIGHWMSSWDGSWLPPEEVIQDRTGQKPQFLQSSISEVTYHHSVVFYWTHRTPLTNVQGLYTQHAYQEGGDHQGPSWRLTTTVGTHSTSEWVSEVISSGPHPKALVSEEPKWTHLSYRSVGYKNPSPDTD